ncbi:MAG: DUF6541 family protein [archaeon]
MKRKSVLIDLLLLGVLSFILVTYCFRGATSMGDGFIHISKLKILTDNLNMHQSFPRWNPYWYFGVPMWRFYSPLPYYIISFFGWIFQLSSVNMVMAWSYLAFSVSAISTYFLAKEMGLKRFGCLASSILFITSGNMLAYWGVGSYPNVTGVAFSPLALLIFFRAIRKKDLSNVLAAGLAFSAIILLYFMNAIILAVFMLVISVVMVIREPSLLFISRGKNTPPKYTLIMPKILGSVLLIAAVTSLWWALPFVTTYMSAPAVADSATTSTSITLVNQLVKILGINMDIFSAGYSPVLSPGVGHVLLALIGCVIVGIKRKTEKIYAPLCLLVAFIFCLSPSLHIPTGPLYWFRFTLYFSLFAALCGGIAVDSLKGFYDKSLGNRMQKKGMFSIDKAYSILMVVLVLLVCVYPVFGNGTVFQGFNLSAPDYIPEIESRSTLGERLAVEGGYDVNMYSDIFQSDGGNVYYITMLNDFGYTFWYYTFIQNDPAYLPYFSRNYNVRWVMSDMDGLVQTDYGVPEVEGFDSSFVEAVGLNETLLLFIGDPSEYSLLFQSQAMINSKDTILVNGGDNLEGYDLETLKKFDAVYLNGLLNGNSEDLETQYKLLSKYVSGGGGVILDTGDIKFEEDMVDIPDIFPVEATAIHSESNFLLAENASTTLTKNLNLTKMSDKQHYIISYGVQFKKGSEVLVLDEDRPVVAYWELGAGKVLWTGLRLPYSSNYYGLSQDINEEARAVYDERAKLLSEMVNFVAKESSGESTAQITVEYPEPEKIIVHIENASSDEGIWVKNTYFPDWTAEIKDEESNLNVFKAGPDMMMVFPDQNGNYTLTFYFGKTWDVVVAETVSLVSITAIAIFFAYKLFRHLKNKHHINSKGIKQNIQAQETTT